PGGQELEAPDTSLTQVTRHKFEFLSVQPRLLNTRCLVISWFYCKTENNQTSMSVQLDASTSSSRLAVSSDRLQVRESAVRSAAPSEEPLAEWPYVLGYAIITAGRHYWEVEVSTNGGWRIGVMSESAPWKRRSHMSPGRGYWTLWKSSSCLWACTEEPTKLQRAAVPRLIGVYVDVGEGQVSFYDVDRRVHIYTFSDTFRCGVVPVFGHLDADTVLKIIPAEMSV
uniref:B30.2/SPRY domain-containing protein n=1 Tax=Cyclopterus lumpus TaxID=8103 RepID=A0A8C3A247_CYCLU